MSLYVGTSGWAFKGWKPGFYPADLPQKRWLEHYARRLGACEINATFYSMRAPSTYEKWASAAPDGFRFAVKAHRALTHSVKMDLNDYRGRMLSEFVSGASTLGPKLGPILFSTPPSRVRDDDAVGALIDALPDSVVPAFDFRNETWAGAEVEQNIAARGGTCVFSEWEGNVPDALPPGSIAYARLRSERYSDRAMQGWLDLLSSEAAERDVYVFVKHEDIAADDSHGGVGLAGWLHDRRALTESPAPKPAP